MAPAVTLQPPPSAEQAKQNSREFSLLAQAAGKAGDLASVPREALEGVLHKSGQDGQAPDLPDQLSFDKLAVSLLRGCTHPGAKGQGDCLGLAAHDKEGKLAPMRFPRRALKPHDVRISIAFCGICHSDLHKVKSQWGPTNYPCVPGHEIVGVVTEGTLEGLPLPRPATRPPWAARHRPVDPQPRPSAPPALAPLSRPPQGRPRGVWLRPRRQGRRGLHGGQLRRVRRLPRRPAAVLQRRRRPGVDVRFRGPRGGRRHQPGRLLLPHCAEREVCAAPAGQPAHGGRRAAALRRHHHLLAAASLWAGQARHARGRRGAGRAGPHGGQAGQGVRLRGVRHLHLPLQA